MGKNTETLHRGAPMDENSVSLPRTPLWSILSASWVFLPQSPLYFCLPWQQHREVGMEGLRKLYVYPKPGGMKPQCIVVENTDYVIP